MRRYVALMVGMLLIAIRPSWGAVASPVVITLGQSVVPLNGPWKFHTGDDLRWSAQDIDDAHWENVDLTPAPGAHDSDVGLSGYVAGWQARGHAGYVGYAWYRLSVNVQAPEGSLLALTGPTDVDSAYELFVNGQRLGGIGNFDKRTPTAYSIRPQLFALPPSVVASHHPWVIAIRVFMGPWDLGADDAGGIHVAPAIGTRREIQSHYSQQWLETFRGYVVEVTEAFLFIVLAAIALSVSLIDRARMVAYRWFAVALVCVAAYRANQAVFYWTPWESVHTFEWLSYVLLTPLCLGTWVMAWGAWFDVRSPSWLRPLIALSTLIYMIAQCVTGSWFYGAWPGWMGDSLSALTTVMRLVLLCALLFITLRGMQRSDKQRWLAVSAMLCVAIGLFAQELSAIHVPGIWFPFGTGVSRTQFAYVGFDVLFATLLWRQQRRFARALHS